ncbi:MAG: hypothetical protein IPM80_13220 [Proteobacteria bacterium]|nr:hypothetical protein [Pseudomonadota bacterium]
MTLPENGLCEHRVTVATGSITTSHERRQYLCKAFDDAGEGLTLVIGMGADYTRRTHNSWSRARIPHTFQNERCSVTTCTESRVLDFDDKKMHSTRRCIAVTNCSPPTSNWACTSTPSRAAPALTPAVRSSRTLHGAAPTGATGGRRAFHRHQAQQAGGLNAGPPRTRSRGLPCD